MNRVHAWLDGYTEWGVTRLRAYMDWAQRVGRTDGEQQILLFGPWVVVGIVGWAGPWWTDAILAVAIGVPVLVGVGKAITHRL